MRVATAAWSGVAVAGALALAGCGSAPSADAPGARSAPPAAHAAAAASGGSPAQGVLPPGTAPVSESSVERALMLARTPPASVPGALPAPGRAPSGAPTAASCQSVGPRVFACLLTFGSTPTRFTVRVQRNGDLIARRQGAGPGPAAVGVWSTAGR